MKFYSVVTRKNVDIPDKDVKEVTKSGRTFLVGTYKHDGKVRQAWRIKPKAQSSKTVKPVKEKAVHEDKLS